MELGETELGGMVSSLSQEEHPRYPVENEETHGKESQRAKMGTRG
jgi:hypothetical protein